MLKLLSKLVLGECSKCKRTAMIRPRLCDETGKMSHSCVMCVPVDSADMCYQSPAAKSSTALLYISQKRVGAYIPTCAWNALIVDTAGKERYIA